MSIHLCYLNFFSICSLSVLVNHSQHTEHVGVAVPF
jgi:hypothetical protein